jgi:tRNA nucleotidyltransferase/poly(A) polymerase
LSLELEKILKSTFSDRHFEVFFDYGLLEYFLPFLSGNWGSNAVKTALNMIYERNCRVSGGWYRDSISLALATAAYPFAAEKICGSTQGFWEQNSEETDSILYQFVEKVFSPQILMVRVREAAVRIMRMQCILENAADSEIPQLMRQKSYSHARELLLIRHLSANEDVSSWERRLPPGKDSGEFRPEKIPSHKKKRNHRGFNDREKSFRKRNRRPVRPADFEE